MHIAHVDERTEMIKCTGVLRVVLVMQYIGYHDATKIPDQSS